MPGNNASASYNGWVFQANAALWLVLHNIKQVDSVVIEGGSQDIEISLTDGQIEYYQAKSSQDPEDTTNFRHFLKDGLVSLSKTAQEKQFARLFYISNLIYPFGKTETKTNFRSPKTFKYSELLKSERDYIKNVVNNNDSITLSEDQLSEINVSFIPFQGSGTTRREEIKKKVDEFLTLAKAPRGYGEKTYNVWSYAFGANMEESDPSVKITKARMMWLLIALICGPDAKEFDELQLDKGDVNYVREHYQNIINGFVDDYQASLGVLADYNEYKNTLQQIDIQNANATFINNNWVKYSDKFKSEELVDSDPRLEAITKISISSLLQNIHYITGIKRGAFDEN